MNMPPRLRIGIDVHICRTSQTGIYTFIWNLMERLQRSPREPETTMIVYGPEIVEEPDSLTRMQAHFGESRTGYLATGAAPLFGRAATGTAASTAGRLLGRWNGAVMSRLWRKLNFATGGFWRLAGRPFTRPFPQWWRDLDVVHHTAGLLLPLHPRANVLTINDLIPHHFKHLYRSELDWFGDSFTQASQMDAILVYSEHTKADVMEVLGVDSHRIHVVPLAAHKHYAPVTDRMKLAEVLRHYGLSDQNYVLHVGSLEPRKNLTRLVEAFHEMTRESPELPHRLVFAGPRFSSYHSIFEAIEHLGLQGRVVWLGAVPFDHLPLLMNGASVFVYPSLYEGFGLPPLEAMACGTPVIASSASSIPEVVGRAALLIDPYRVKDMTEAMTRVLTEPSLADRMRSEGLEQAARFSWDRTAELTLKVYDAAIEQATIRNSAAAAGDRARNEGLPPPSRNRLIVNQWLFERFRSQASDPGRSAS